MATNQNKNGKIVEGSQVCYTNFYIDLLNHIKFDTPSWYFLKNTYVILA